jgi:hypothetical protein
VTGSYINKKIIDIQPNIYNKKKYAFLKVYNSAFHKIDMNIKEKTLRVSLLIIKRKFEYI